jgi:molybdopterin-guanine dinucleotide biosynthesis protein A
MTTTQKLYGLILAGGFSKRMGQDKALMMYHGKPQIEYVRDLLQRHCNQVFLSKRTSQPTYKDLAAIDDDEEFTNIGPLGGILSAMKSYPNGSWLIMACDLPFVTEETLKELIKNRNVTKVATAFKSTHDGLPEPLCAIWEKESYLKILEFQKKGILCPRKFLINSDTQLLEQKNPKWLDNINNPQEYQEAVKLC